MFGYVVLDGLLHDAQGWNQENLLVAFGTFYESFFGGVAVWFLNYFFVDCFKLVFVVCGLRHFFWPLTSLDGLICGFEWL